jgi:hypothetical protein
MDFRRRLPEIRWQSCLLGWAFGPREFMKNGGACLACQPAEREAVLLNASGFSPRVFPAGGWQAVGLVFRPSTCY